MIYVKAKIVALKTPTWLIKQKLFRDLKFKLFPGLLNSEIESDFLEPGSQESKYHALPSRVGMTSYGACLIGLV